MDRSYNVIQIVAMVLMIIASIKQGEIMHFLMFNYILFLTTDKIKLEKDVDTLKTIIKSIKSNSNE